MRQLKTDPVYTDPETGAEYRHKYFRKNLKRPWSFTCDHCRKKVSSAEHVDYYVGYLPVDDETQIGVRGCSEECVLEALKETKRHQEKIEQSSRPDALSTQPIAVTMTNAQWDTLEHEAKVHGMNIHEYVTHLCLERSIYL